MAAATRTNISVGVPQYPVLNAFMASRARVSAIMGPLGSGKTYGSIFRLLAHMVEQEPNAKGERPTRFLSVRNTYPDLMGSTLKDFLGVFEGLGKMRYGGLAPPTFTVDFHLDDGTRVKSEMVFLALDRDDGVRKLRGQQLTGVYFNEAAEIPKAIIDMADLRHGRYPSLAAAGVLPTFHGMILDLNACDDSHWFYHLAEEVRPEGWDFFRQPGGVLPGEGEGEWVPNPDAENLSNLPDGYYSRGLSGKSQDWISTMLSNEYGFLVDGKPVHPWFVDSIHTAPEPIEADHRFPLTVGIDFGRTPAAVVTQHIESMGRWVVLCELVATDMSASIFGPELKRFLDQNYSGMPVEVWCDPAGSAKSQATEDTPIRILRAAGIPAKACHSNNPDLRRASVSNPALRICMDGKPALQVSPRAKMVRKGLMGGFCYRRMKIAGSERYTDLPDKNEYSHPVESLEYALMGGGEGRDALIPANRHRGERTQTQALM